MKRKEKEIRKRTVGWKLRGNVERDSYAVKQNRKSFFLTARILIFPFKKPPAVLSGSTVGGHDEVQLTGTESYPDFAASLVFDRLGRQQQGQQRQQQRQQHQQWQQQQPRLEKQRPVIVWWTKPLVVVLLDCFTFVSKAWRKLSLIVLLSLGKVSILNTYDTMLPAL